jgi:uncharacterized protein (TIGR00661 family)
LPTNFNIQTILVAPLDWGLGHATRCIPIINVLLKNNYKVIIAATGKQKTLLQNEFPGIGIINLKGYNVTYSKYKLLLPFKIAIQIPKIVFSIYSENKWLKHCIQQHKIDCVISDNRYGLFSKTVPCIFISHQLMIKIPFIWLEKIVQKINYFFINQFTACWVPDFEGDRNIAANLSHPNYLPKIPVNYIGILSRFTLHETHQKQKYYFCVMLSGPEPQRTILETKVIEELSKTDKPILFIRGLPNETKPLKLKANFEVKNHLSGIEINQALLQSQFIICRSGYTTVMEIVSLQKKAIVIPTPSQTEQEYLAKNLMLQQWCFAIEQQNFCINILENELQQFQFKLPHLPINSLQQIIPNLLKPISENYLTKQA